MKRKREMGAQENIVLRGKLHFAYSKGKFSGEGDVMECEEVAEMEWLERLYVLLFR